MSSSAPSADPRPVWAQKVERGSVGALAVLIRLLRTLGRRRVRWLVSPVALYFLITDRNARVASRQYLARLSAFAPGAVSHRGTLRASYRHFCEFSTSILDRVCVWAGLDEDFVFDHDGAGHFAHLPDAEGDRANALGKTGALIFGAHLGTFDMMRALCLEADVSVNVVIYGGNAEQINGFFRMLDPDFSLQLIHVTPESRGAALEIRAAIERGEFVAVLADRLPIAGSSHHSASFLGEAARFPEGPFQLASVIGCPVMLATARRVGEAQYKVESESLYAGGRVPRRDRDAVVRELIERYADWLERACVASPYQWFNFFEFWEHAERRS